MWGSGPGRSPRPCTLYNLPLRCGPGDAAIGDLDASKYVLQAFAWSAYGAVDSAMLVPMKWLRARR
jgi:hypothetical protein